MHATAPMQASGGFEEPCCRAGGRRHDDGEHPLVSAKKRAATDRNVAECGINVDSAP